MSINLQLGVDGRLHKIGKKRERRGGWDGYDFSDDAPSKRELAWVWAKEIAVAVAFMAAAVGFCWLCCAASGAHFE